VHGMAEGSEAGENEVGGCVLVDGTVAEEKE
jgi:hypothetical protein